VGTWALKEMAGDADYDYRRFAEDYAKGDEKARRLFATISTALGAGALALVHLYDAETVIWSGGASHFTPLLDAAQEYVWAHSWTPWGKVRFVVADNPEASVILGLHALFAEMPTR
jgi:glucokinase